ncbi:MAG TPA: toll/interleukin-1 receptor domain-containing protein, partial [Ktedonobacteraceae bacterium]|nr:toll/interleukin-1 receptor domain-containing protein [Ktedonobacteraceae bacterium]
MKVGLVGTENRSIINRGSGVDYMALKIFICYAHEDETLLNKLKTHLRPLQRQGLIDVWHDRDISAGTEWEQEITEQLNSAQIILLLVSPD